MTNFKEYFRSHMKASIRTLVYILVTVLVLTFLLANSIQPTHTYDFDAMKSYKDYKSTLILPVFFLCALAYIFPVTEFSVFKKRLNLDCAYSLPISRRAMGAVHYLTGLIMMLVSFTLSYLLNFIMMLSRGSGWFNFAPMIAHYFLCLLLGTVMYSVMVFVFNQANTKGDGIWFIILYTFVLAIILTSVETIFDNNNIIKQMEYSLPWGTVRALTGHYQYLVEMDYPHRATFWQYSYNIAWLVFWLVAGVASVVGFFLSFGKRRMERTEEISDSFFGYRVLIPVLGFGGILSVIKAGFIVHIMIELFALLGYTIYRRGFHYKKSDIAILAAMLVFIFVCNLI